MLLLFIMLLVIDMAEVHGVNKINKKEREPQDNIKKIREANIYGFDDYRGEGHQMYPSNQTKNGPQDSVSKKKGRKQEDSTDKIPFTFNNGNKIYLNRYFSPNGTFIYGTQGPLKSQLVLCHNDDFFTNMHAKQNNDVPTKRDNIDVLAKISNVPTGYTLARYRAIKKKDGYSSADHGNGLDMKDENIEYKDGKFSFKKKELTSEDGKVTLFNGIEHHIRRILLRNGISDGYINDNLKQAEEVLNNHGTWNDFIGALLQKTTNPKTLRKKLDNELTNIGFKAEFGRKISSIIDDHEISDEEIKEEQRKEHSSNYTIDPIVKDEKTGNFVFNKKQTGGIQTFIRRIFAGRGANLSDKILQDAEKMLNVPGTTYERFMDKLFEKTNNEELRKALDDELKNIGFKDKFEQHILYISNNYGKSSEANTTDTSSQWSNSSSFNNGYSIYDPLQYDTYTQYSNGYDTLYPYSETNNISYSNTQYNSDYSNDYFNQSFNPNTDIITECAFLNTPSDNQAKYSTTTTYQDQDTYTQYSNGYDTLYPYSETNNLDNYLNTLYALGHYDTDKEIPLDCSFSSTPNNDQVEHSIETTYPAQNVFF